MSAKHALLGLLLHRSAYPYELSNRLQVRMGPAWAINSGQVYQTTARMEALGLIERVDDVGEGRSDRHFFAITESGTEEYERWFDQDIREVQLSRRPLLVKITLAGPERLEDALKQIDAYELACAKRLKEFSGKRDEVSDEGPRVRADLVLLRLNLSADIFRLEAELRWARHAHEIVSWLLARDAIWPSTPERSGALPEEARSRREAREELFGRMAARQLQSTDQQEAGDEK